MREQLEYLVKEYFLAVKRLKEIKGRYLELLTASEIAKEMETEIKKEIQRAQEGEDKDSVKFWQDILDNCYRKDNDFPPTKDLKEAQDELKRREKEIVYYQRKLKVIKRLLGVRETELLESFQEKLVLMGTHQNSSLNFQLVREKEEEEDKIREDRKSNITFDKM